MPIERVPISVNLKSTTIMAGMRVRMDDRGTADVPAAFRFAMRRLASTVAVVTALDKGARVGMTASSITSLTLNPPALLVCVNQSASIHACLEVGAPFCVNLLASAQREIPAVFAGGLTGEARFAHGVWTPDERGVPRLEDAQANISCSVDRMLAYGTHSIVIGRVEAVRIVGAVDPLVFQDGRYLIGMGAVTEAVTNIR
jgi:flavin reductase (DIM6/NTAB) family NADH-FMN oxidoreductase RutF